MNKKYFIILMPLIMGNRQHVRSACGWLLVLVYFERKVLLAGC
jgi:hypothetical protein